MKFRLAAFTRVLTIAIFCAVQPSQATFGAPSTTEVEYTRLVEQVGRLRAALILAYGQGSEDVNVSQILAKFKARGQPDLHDEWGTELRLELNPHYRSYDEARGTSHILVRSAGPDRQFDTDDDLIVSFSINTGRNYLRFLNQADRLGAVFSQAYDEGTEGGDLSKVFAQMKDRGAPDIRDQWGTELHLEPSPFSSGEKIIRAYYVLRSAGPDRQFGTKDDLGIYIEARTGNLSEFGPLGDTIALKVVSEHGPSNGLAEIVGSIDEDRPGFLKSAIVEAVEARTGKSHRTETSAEQRFSLTSLPPGEYKIRVSSPGVGTLWREVTLRPGDRAVVVVATERCNYCGIVMQITGPVLDDDDLVIGWPHPIPLPPPPPSVPNLP